MLGQIRCCFVLIPFEFHKTNIRDSRSYINDDIRFCTARFPGFSLIYF